ncbi:YraN family protein [Adlercreutzia sp. ZJ141]|uniref:YraN family protein n=1 Tax=Adlercreutzia sp. ZJ141 TaxID=2709406 RepID=UPI0013EA9D29|nr:YraN family protein [Adlercreutzia sp. ZJ141]
MKEIIKKSNQAIAAYLNRRGYEIVEQPWEADIDSRVSIVAKDKDALVFTTVTACKDSDSFPAEHLNQEELEGFAIKWLKDNRSHADCAVRFDRIGLLIMSPDRAFIKHHINVMSCSNIPGEE